MRVLIAIDVANLLSRAGHLPVAAEIVEEHKARIEVDAFENIVGHEHFHKLEGRAVVHKRIVKVANEFIAIQEDGVVLPLKENGVALFGRTNRIEHITVTLRMDGLLEGLYIQAEIDFARRDVLANVGQVGRLNTVEEDEERQNLIVSRALGRQEFTVVFQILP